MECIEVETSHQCVLPPIEHRLLGDAAALRMLKLRLDNIRELEALRKVINEEEDKVLSVDDVLARVLKFYGMFVPYK